VLATDISDRIQSEEKIRALATELTRAEQDERYRISQVLHDDLQQRLFAVKAQLSFLKDVNMSAETYRELDQIQASLSESIAITRNLSIDLSPIVLQGEGLLEAMTWLSFRMKEQYGTWTWRQRRNWIKSIAICGCCYSSRSVSCSLTSSNMPVSRRRKSRSSR
jgi:signal transduction histidine kinase